MPSKTTTSATTTEPNLWAEGFPQFLDAIQGVADGRPDTEAKTEQLLRLLDKNAESGDDETRALWTAAAALTRKVLVERPGPLPLIDHSQEYEERPGTGWQTLCAWCYLGASVDVRTPPSLAIALHMTVAEFLYNETHESKELYETIILPWFTNFWTRVFADARFRFQFARLVETEFKTALESDLSVRLQGVLGAMGFGLDVTLPDEGREWFKRNKE